jgi:hypothetical protein
VGVCISLDARQALMPFERRDGQMLADSGVSACSNNAVWAQP